MPLPDPKPTLFPKDLWSALWTITDQSNATPTHKTLGKLGPEYADHCDINPDDVSFLEDSPSELAAAKTSWRPPLPSPSTTSGRSTRRSAFRSRTPSAVRAVARSKPSTKPWPPGEPPPDGEPAYPSDETTPTVGPCRYCAAGSCRTHAGKD